MRFNPPEVLFVLGALVFALVLFVEGISASPSGASMVLGVNNAKELQTAGSSVVYAQTKEGKSGSVVFWSSASTEVVAASTEANDACKLENEAMLARDPTWKMESMDFETERLPRCLHEWAVETLPPNTKQYPVLECKAPLAWTSACYAAGGMVATVTATARFLEANSNSNATEDRILTFPTCFSSNKACTSTRNAADYLWVERLNQVMAWCANQTNPYTQCSDVRLETNFWQIASLPKIIRIVIAVLVSLAVVVLIIIIIVYCRWKHKRQHDEALERTLLLKLARKSALVQSQATDSDMHVTLDASSSIGSTPNTLYQSSLLQNNTHDASTPLLRPPPNQFT
jgi:hypothetical protein